MKRYIFSAALILSSLLVSCSQEGMETDGVGKQIIAKSSTLETKTSVGSPVEGTNAVGINWTDGDQIGVFDAAGTAQKCYAKVGTGTVPTAAFAVSGSTAFESPVYAYYPYSASNNGKAATALTGTMPATQSADGKLHGDYKYGRLVGSSASGSEFEFAHLFSLARFSIDVAGTYLAGESLTSVKLTATRGGSPLAIAGDFTFDVRNGSWEQSGSGSNSITLSWAPGLTLNQPMTCYMNLFPTLRVGDQITIELVTANHTARVTSPCKANFIKENIYNFPLAINEYSQLVILDDEGNYCYGTFTCAALNVDGLPSLINPEGPGSSGTTTLGQIANNVGWDFFAVSEDFEYHSQLSSALTNYNAGTYRGTVDVSQVFGAVADTDGLEFFWKRDGVTATGETYIEFNDKKGGLFNGANESIKKGFRHYVVTVAQGVVVDVYITHMNTYEGEGNTEETNEYVRAVLSQLRQMRDYVLANAKTNNRPAIIMGDSNMRYTRHKISENFIDYINNNVSGSYAGYTVVDPWVKCNRNNVYPTWNTPSLMIRSKFAGWEGDIVACDDQRGEVVDKMWYINVPTSPVQIEALSCENDVAHFTKSTEDVTYSGVQAEDAAGNVMPGSTISYTKRTGYADHFPVVAKFRYTRTQ